MACLEGSCCRRANPSPNKPVAHALAYTPPDLAAPIIIHDLSQRALCLEAKRDRSSNPLSTSPKLRLRRKSCLAHSESLGSHKVQDLLAWLDVSAGVILTQCPGLPSPVQAQGLLGDS